MSQSELREAMKLMGLDTDSNGLGGARRRRILVKRMHDQLVKEFMDQHR